MQKRRTFDEHEKSKFWNYKLNSGEPKDYTFSSGKKFWFDCEKCGHSFDMTLTNVTMGNCWCGYCNGRKRCPEEKNCDICFIKTFASHEKSKFWNKEKNGGKSPYEFALQSNKKVWFNCEKCKHSFEKVMSHVVKNKWCPYCCNQKRCPENIDCELCHNNSFASHKQSKFWNYEKNGSVHPRDLAICSTKKMWFDCEKCKHAFQMKIENITRKDCWCQYCANQILCLDLDCVFCHRNSFASHPLSQYWNDEKNYCAPREVFKGSDEEFHFICKCKEEFFMSLTRLNVCHWQCKCNNNYSFLERDLYYNLEQRSIEFKTQVRYDDCRRKHCLRFDCEITLAKDCIVVIELQGEQHFHSTDYFEKLGRSFIKQQESDLIKTKYIINKKNYYYVAISYKCLKYIDNILDVILAEPKRHYFFVRKFYTIEQCNTEKDKLKHPKIFEAYNKILKECNMEGMLL